MGGAIVGEASFGAATPSTDWTLPVRPCPWFNRRGASILTRLLLPWAVVDASFGDGWAEDLIGDG